MEGIRWRDDVKWGSAITFGRLGFTSRSHRHGVNNSDSYEDR